MPSGSGSTVLLGSPGTSEGYLPGFSCPGLSSQLYFWIQTKIQLRSTQGFPYRNPPPRYPSRQKGEFCHPISANYCHFLRRVGPGLPNRRRISGIPRYLCHFFGNQCRKVVRKGKTECCTGRLRCIFRVPDCPDVSKCESKSVFQVNHINFTRTGTLQEDPGQISPSQMGWLSGSSLPLKHLQCLFSMIQNTIKSTQRGGLINS
jgi:hypothetical protein